MVNDCERAFAALPVDDVAPPPPFTTRLHWPAAGGVNENANSVDSCENPGHCTDVRVSWPPGRTSMSHAYTATSTGEPAKCVEPGAGARNPTRGVGMQSFPGGHSHGLRACSPPVRSAASVRRSAATTVWPPTPPLPASIPADAAPAASARTPIERIRDERSMHGSTVVRGPVGRAAPDAGCTGSSSSRAERRNS